MIDNNISFYINKEEVNISSFSNIFLWRVLLPCWKMTKQFIWRGMWQLFSPFTRNVFLSKDLPKKRSTITFFWFQQKWYGQTDEQGILDSSKQPPFDIKKFKLCLRIWKIWEFKRENMRIWKKNMRNVGKWHCPNMRS